MFKVYLVDEKFSKITEMSSSNNLLSMKITFYKIKYNKISEFGQDYDACFNPMKPLGSFSLGSINEFKVNLV